MRHNRVLSLPWKRTQAVSRKAAGDKQSPVLCCVAEWCSDPGSTFKLGMVLSTSCHCPLLLCVGGCWDKCGWAVGSATWLLGASTGSTLFPHFPVVLALSANWVTCP